MCSGRGTLIGWDEGQYGGSGVHAFDMKMRSKNRNGKGNGKSNENVSNERMFVPFIVNCLHC